MIPYERPDWQAHGACRGTDPALFYGAVSKADVEQARAVCADCPVKNLCAAWSLANNEKFGVWGGLSERQRRTVRHDKARWKRIRSAAYLEATLHRLTPPALWQDGKPTRPCLECHTVFVPETNQFLYCERCAEVHRSRSVA